MFAIVFKACVIVPDEMLKNGAKSLVGAKFKLKQFVTDSLCSELIVKGNISSVGDVNVCCKYVW